MSALIVIIAAIAIAGVAFMFYQHQYRRDLVARVLAESGFVLKHASPARIFDHPDFLEKRYFQRPAYRVSAVDGEGTSRNGVVLLGEGFIMAIERGAQVIWDDMNFPSARNAFPVVFTNQRPPSIPPRD